MQAILYIYIYIRGDEAQVERERGNNWQRGFVILYRENLCFNNYCDIGARVRKANQRRCARVNGRMDGRGRQIDRQGARGSGPDRGGTRRSRGGCEKPSRGMPPFAKMASLHSSTTEPRLLPASLPPRPSPAMLRVGEQLANTDRPFSIQYALPILSSTPSIYLFCL